MWIDTHAHLYSEQFTPDRDAMMERMLSADVQKALLPNIDSESVQSMLALEHQYPDHCFAMMGLHPCSVTDDYSKELDLIAAQLEQRAYIAIGEIGIDMYWDDSKLSIQRDAFCIQARWAMELGIPIAIHARESMDILLKEVDQLQDGSLTGVFHCFTGSVEQANVIEKLGFYMGIGGVVTFKNGGLDQVLPKVPIERIVLETDAPYLSPSPYRGKRNESAYIPIIGQKVADIYQVPIQKVADTTTANAKKLFQLS